MRRAAGRGPFRTVNRQEGGERQRTLGACSYREKAGGAPAREAKWPGPGGTDTSSAGKEDGLYRKHPYFWESLLMQRGKARMGLQRTMTKGSQGPSPSELTSEGQELSPETPLLAYRGFVLRKPPSLPALGTASGPTPPSRPCSSIPPGLSSRAPESPCTVAAGPRGMAVLPARRVCPCGGLQSTPPASTFHAGHFCSLILSPANCGSSLHPPANQ